MADKINLGDHQIVTASPLIWLYWLSAVRKSMQTNCPAAEVGERFRDLQHQLQDLWQSVELIEPYDRDILVLPSLSLDQRELKKIEASHYYEERLLFALLRLRNPRTRVIYVTSQPIHPSIIDYYLQFTGVPYSHIRDRLLLLSTYDLSSKPLTEKILKRPRLLQQIRQALRPGLSYMVCYNVSALERELSLQLNVPLFGLDPDLLYLGTKGGSRQLFAEVGIPFPDGSGTCKTVSELAVATAELWERQPQSRKFVVKLNEGISGEGNASLDLEALQSVAPGTAEQPERVKAIEQQFQNLHFQSKHENWENFSHRIPELGAIVEAFVGGEEKRSPSVQGIITPTGQVEILSTHDQVLDDQIFLGCSFPADQAYRLQLQELGQKVGEKLAQKGVLERFAIDFLAVRRPELSTGWDLQAIEVNIRKGGTTHPFMILRFLTHGRYDCDSGLFYGQQGEPKYYVALDNLQKDQYRGLLPSDLIDIIATHKVLQFDATSQTGNVFHLMGSLSEFGKLGITSIGNSPEHASDLYNKAVEVLDQETDLKTFSSDAATRPMGWQN